MIDKIYKWFGWKCEWELEQRIALGQHKTSIYDVYKDTNTNGLARYKRVRVNITMSPFNEHEKFLDVK